MTLARTPLRDVPVAVLDFETTGLSPAAGSRIVEVAVVRCEPERAPTLVLDTLVDPQGPVHGSRLHGIEDDDVVGAPMFGEVAADVITALSGAVVACYNAAFDFSFLVSETRRAARAQDWRRPPHICLMWLRPLLGLGPRCTLGAASQAHGIAGVTHRAAEDALVCGHMWEHYLAAATARGMRTLGDLRSLGSHRYLASLDQSPYGADDAGAIRTRASTAHKPRAERIVPPNAMIAARDGNAARDYWHGWMDALSDQWIANDELDYLRRLRRGLALSPETVRAVHARVYADCLSRFAEDEAVTDDEATLLMEIREAMRKLGLAPGTLTSPRD